MKTFKQHQKWRMRGGIIATIGPRTDTGLPTASYLDNELGPRFQVFSPSGRYWFHGDESPFDLVELVEDAPTIGEGSQVDPVMALPSVATAPASAQPDRGAAQDERALFEKWVASLDVPADALERWPDGRYVQDAIEGYWGGWQARAAAPSPASQPVAPEATQAVPSNASVKDMLRWLGVDTDYHGKIAFTLGQFARFVDMLRAAVAPSDAKDATVPDHSERGAANAGGLTSTDLKTLRFAADALEGLDYEDTAGDLREIVTRAPATIAAGQEAANAKDAARWRKALMHVGGTYCSEGVRFTLRGLSPIKDADIMKGSVAQHFTEAIDAAIAAASELAATGKTLFGLPVVIDDSVPEGKAVFTSGRRTVVADVQPAGAVGVCMDEACADGECRGTMCKMTREELEADNRRYANQADPVADTMDHAQLQALGNEQAWREQQEKGKC